MKFIFLGITFAVGIAVAQNSSISLEGAELRLGMSKSDALRLLKDFEIRKTETDGLPDTDEIFTVRKKESAGGTGESHSLQFEKGNLIMVNKELGGTQNSESMRMLSQFFYAISRNAVKDTTQPGRASGSLFAVITTDDISAARVQDGEVRIRSVTIDLPAPSGVTRGLYINITEPIGRSGSVVSITEILERSELNPPPKSTEKH
jgi:hypothetical protein